MNDKKYFYIPSFVSKRLKDKDITIYKNNFIKTNNLKEIKLLESEVKTSLENIDFNYGDFNIEELLKKGDGNIEEVSNLIYKLFNLKQNIKAENTNQLTLIVIAESLAEVFRENINEFTFNDISGFNSHYYSKKCDLVLSEKIFHKYSMYMKNIILHEESVFLSEIESKEEKITKKELNESLELYRMLLGFSAKIKSEIAIYNNNLPKFRYDFERRHMKTEKSKVIIEKSKEVESSINNIILEFEEIIKTIQKRILKLEEIRDKKYVNFSKMKKNFFENLNFIPFIKK